MWHTSVEKWMDRMTFKCMRVYMVAIKAEENKKMQKTRKAIPAGPLVDGTYFIWMRNSFSVSTICPPPFNSSNLSISHPLFSAVESLLYFCYFCFYSYFSETKSLQQFFVHPLCRMTSEHDLILSYMWAYVKWKSSFHFITKVGCSLVSPMEKSVSLFIWNL